jgi:hypothetical protein
LCPQAANKAAFLRLKLVKLQNWQGKAGFIRASHTLKFFTLTPQLAPD